MCLAVPGEILSIEETDPPFRRGRASFGGAERDVNLSFVPEARVGDFVLVHVGVAISRIDAEEARRTFQYLEEIEGLEIPD